MEGEGESTAMSSPGDSQPWTNVKQWAYVHGSSLLFVDDNAMLLELIARAFEKLGTWCRTASNHDDAVKALEEDDALRIAVVDFEMPDGDVAELIRRVRGTRPEVILVGTSGGDRRRQFEDRGVDRFVPKPWRIGDLVDASER